MVGGLEVTSSSISPLMSNRREAKRERGREGGGRKREKERGREGEGRKREKEKEREGGGIERGGGGGGRGVTLIHS